MNMHIFKKHTQAVMSSSSSSAQLGHRVESTFDNGTCHFVLTCSCGTGFETNHIDEALEWSEMHKAMASLADQLTV
jgi:hypothetical protein